MIFLDEPPAAARKEEQRDVKTLLAASDGAWASQVSHMVSMASLKLWLPILNLSREKLEERTSSGSALHFTGRFAFPWFVT